MPFLSLAIFHYFIYFGFLNNVHGPTGSTRKTHVHSCRTRKQLTRILTSQRWKRLIIHFHLWLVWMRDGCFCLQHEQTRANSFHHQLQSMCFGRFHIHHERTRVGHFNFRLKKVGSRVHSRWRRKLPTLINVSCWRKGSNHIYLCRMRKQATCIHSV